MGIDLPESVMPESYDDHIRYLIDYAKVDWVGFSPIVGAAAALVRAGDPRNCVDVMMQLIGDMLDNGVSAGDLVASDEHPFDRWDDPPAQILTAIRGMVSARDDLPDSGDICWFTVL